MTSEEENDTAAIDLAVAFFSAVLTVFVFVQFVLSDRPENEPRASIGQQHETIAAVTPTWHPIAERGSFAVLRGTTLTVLNLSALSAGIMDSRDGYFADNGGQSFRALEESAPNSFSLTIRFIPSDIPEPWRREVVELANEAATCPETVQRVLTVFVGPETENLSPLITHSKACEIYPRFVYTSGKKTDDQLVSQRIGLSPSAYARERIFR